MLVQGSQRRAATLIEMVMGMTVMSIVIGGMASSILLASRALDDGTSPETRVAESADRVVEIAAETKLALAYLELSDHAIEFTVPDRTGDGVPEEIRYAWSGTPGDPITRTYNGGTAITWLPKVDVFKVQHLTRTLMPPNQACCNAGACTEEPAETCMGSGGDAMGVGSDCLTADCYLCFDDISVQVATGTNDAEESNSGSMDIGSGDLELGVNEGSPQTIGLRFQQIDIPQGATIREAFIDLVAEQADSGACSLTIQAEGSDNPLPFVASSSNITLRPMTAASVDWAGVPDWTAGDTFSTPDLGAIVQEIVDRPGWLENNAMVFVFQGTGQRSAFSFEGSPTQSAVLRITCDDGTVTEPTDNCGDTICGAGETSCNCPADCGAPANAENTNALCADGLDNDCDGKTDCADNQCKSNTVCLIQVE